MYLSYTVDEVLSVPVDSRTETVSRILEERDFEMKKYNNLLEVLVKLLGGEK